MQGNGWVGNPHPRNSLGINNVKDEILANEQELLRYVFISYYVTFYSHLCLVHTNCLLTYRLLRACCMSRPSLFPISNQPNNFYGEYWYKVFRNSIQALMMLLKQRHDLPLVLYEHYIRSLVLRKEH